MNDSHELKVAAFTKLFDAWLAGKTIQIKNIEDNNTWDEEDDTWTDCANISTIYHHTRYRIKPITITYQLALLKGYKGPYISIEYSTNIRKHSDSSNFIKYISQPTTIEV